MGQIFFRPVSEKTAKVIALAMIFFFAVFTQVSSFILPDYYSNDTMNMVDIAEEVVSGGDASLAVIAVLVRIFTLPLLTVIIQIAACAIMFYLVPQRRTVLTMAVSLYTLAVTVPLSLIRPQKEVLVLLLTAFVVLIIRKSSSPQKAIIGVLVAYTFYWAVSLRPYYILIVGLIVLLEFMFKCSPRRRLFAFAIILLAGFLVPDMVFELFRKTRDGVNELRVLFPDLPGNRSAFSNPVVGGGWPGFLINYLYAAMRLNLSLLFSYTPNEFALTLFTTMWFYTMKLAYHTGDWRAQLVVRLIVAHLGVLCIFEPDLGSYLRHFSSLLLYLPLMLAAIERQKGRVRDEKPLIAVAQMVPQ